MGRNTTAFDDTRARLVSGIVAGMVGGLVGSWTMSQFQVLVSRATAPSDQPSPNSDADATEKLAQ